MKLIFRRILPCFLVFVTIFVSAIVPASAASDLDAITNTDFLTWITEQAVSTQNWWKHTLFDSDICPKSPETNGLHEFVKRRTTVNGSDGVFWVCKYCGQSSSELGQSAYDDYVSGLEYTEIGQNGVYVYSGTAQPTGSYTAVTFSSISDDFAQVAHAVFVFSLTGQYVWFKNKALTAPISGTYTFSPVFSYSNVVLEEDTVLTATFLPVYVSSGKNVPIKYDSVSNNIFVVKVSAITVDTQCEVLFCPRWYVVPDTMPDIVTNIDSRPTSITGNYGIIGSDGTINNVTSNTIVNETNNTVYNPVTDTTTPITSWSYDYSDRSYNVVTESGDTITITYGDENITINEGDTIYNVYYVVDDPGSGDGEDGCSHDWVQTSTTEPSCTASGKTVYTCSLCGETKKEIVKALGHEWLAKKTVTTQYDDDGNLIQEGYTLYECERCGEQYKDASGNGPPSSGTGGNGGGSGSGTDSDGLFSGIFGIVWDFFTFFFDFFSDFVVGGIKGFVSGLLDAGSDFFAILNPFDWGY